MTDATVWFTTIGIFTVAILAAIGFLWVTLAFLSTIHRNDQ